MAAPERFGTQKVCWSVAQDRDRKKDTLLLIKEETITTCGCPDSCAFVYIFLSSPDWDWFLLKLDLKILRRV